MSRFVDQMYLPDAGIYVPDSWRDKSAAPHAA
jgi:hypothetical protein